MKSENNIKAIKSLRAHLKSVKLNHAQQLRALKSRHKRELDAIEMRINAMSENLNPATKSMDRSKLN